MSDEIVVWWVSNRKMVVKVKTRNQIIVEAAPIVQKFVGQHFENLIRWLQKSGPPVEFQKIR